MKACVFLLMALLISGCTTKHAKLEAFVDKDIQEVMTAYGQPHVAFDMEEDRRDYQWVMSSSRLPFYPVSAGALTEPGAQFEPAIENRTITPMFNGKVIMSECLYIMKTRWDDDTKRWIVTGYQKPTDGC